MSETNPLLQDPFFSEPILRKTPEAGSRPLTELIGESQVDLPPPPTGREIAADVGKSLVSGGAKGLAGTMIGAPGSIETFVAKDIPEAVRSGAAYLGEQADLISPEQRIGYIDGLPSARLDNQAVREHKTGLVYANGCWRRAEGIAR